MKSEYLREINCECPFPKPGDERIEQFEEEIKQYGFASYETWNLDITFVEFIYIMFKMYDDWNRVDTHFHHFMIDGEEWDQQKCIDYIIEESKKCLISYRDNYVNTKIPEKLYNVLKEIIPVMWW